MSAATSLIGLSFEALIAALEGTGLDPKPARMRARQLWNWIYVHGARDFASMTNLAKDFRGQMAERFTLARPDIVTEQISQDGTRKFLIEQGFEMGRPSQIHMEVTVAGGQLRQVRIGGRAVRVSSGQIGV